VREGGGREGEGGIGREREGNGGMEKVPIYFILIQDLLGLSQIFFQ